MGHTRELYGAVRVDTDSSREFTCADEFGVSRDCVRRKVKEAADTIPGWTLANPLRRIAKFRVTEEVA